jgi:hypothetical protein
MSPYSAETCKEQMPKKKVRCLIKPTIEALRSGKVIATGNTSAFEAIFFL